MKRLLSAALFAAIASLGLSMAPASAQYLNGGHVQADHLCTSRVGAGIHGLLEHPRRYSARLRNHVEHVDAGNRGADVRLDRIPRAQSVSLTAFMSATEALRRSSREPAQTAHPMRRRCFP